MNPSIIATLKNNDFVRKTYRWGRKGISWFHNMIEEIEYTLTEGRKLRQFKDIYKGERCFIIGNGSSLKMHDLTKLAKEKKFAVNMFPLHPQFDKINVDFYCASDWIHWSVNDGFSPVLRNAFRKLPDCKFFFELSCKPVYKKTKELQDRHVFFLLIKESPQVMDGFFETKVEKYVNWGGSVISDFCLPLAYYFGFSKIYLIGCDFSYSQTQKISSSYFYSAEKDDRQIDSSAPHSYAGNLQHINQVMKSFVVVKKVFEANGRKIYNAGYGGKLEVFERVNYDDLF